MKEVDGRPLPHENLHREGVGIYALPRIPWIGRGESLVRTKDSLEILGKVGGEINGERFWQYPVTGLVFRNEGQGLENMSWVVEIEGMEGEVLEYLQQAGKGAVTVRILELAEELGQVAGVSKMVEIGFNAGGGELALKRILLPEVFSQAVELPEEMMISRGEKMPTVFVEMWEALGVAEYDPEWDERVRGSLLGNRRDMSRETKYWIDEQGRSMIDWQAGGGEMPVVMLSDKQDLARALVEERELAELMVGELKINYYGGHNSGDGGGLSLATREELPDQEYKIADIKLKLANGQIVQRSVEGAASEIESLALELGEQMRKEFDLIPKGSGPKDLTLLGELSEALGTVEPVNLNWHRTNSDNASNFDDRGREDDQEYDQEDHQEDDQESEDPEYPDGGGGQLLSVLISQGRFEEVIGLDDDGLSSRFTPVDWRTGVEKPEIDEVGVSGEERNRDYRQGEELRQTDKSNKGGRQKTELIFDKRRREKNQFTPVDWRSGVRMEQQTKVNKPREKYPRGTESKNCEQGTEIKMVRDETGQEINKGDDVKGSVDITRLPWWEIPADMLPIESQSQTAVQPPWFEWQEMVMMSWSLAVPSLEVFCRAMDDKNPDFIWVASVVLLLISDTLRQQLDVKSVLVTEGWVEAKPTEFDIVSRVDQTERQLTEAERLMI